MTEDRFRTILREELDPFKDEVIEKLDILGKRLEVASTDRQEMMRILRLLEGRRSGGRSSGPTEMAAKSSN